MFDVMEGESNTVPVKPPPQKRARLVAEPNGGGSEAHSSEEEVEPQASEEEVEPQASEEEAESKSGSSSSSSSNSSSSKSSSTSSSKHGGNRSPKGGGDDDDDDDAPVQGSDIEGSQMQGASGASRSRLLESTEWWRGFKFTEIEDGDDVHRGWEATCRHISHSDCICRRTLRFGRRGTPELIRRKLRWWFLQANVYATGSLHVHGCPKQPPPGAKIKKRAEANEHTHTHT